MLLKTDENLHPELATLLRQQGHDALTVWDQGMRGGPGELLAERCRHEGRILVTLDAGFADIRRHPPEASSGIIVLKLRSQGRRSVLEAGRRLASLLARRPVAGRLWVVDESRIRERGGTE